MEHSDIGTINEANSAEDTALPKGKGGTLNRLDGAALGTKRTVGLYAQDTVKVDDWNERFKDSKASVDGSSGHGKNLAYGKEVGKSQNGDEEADHARAVIAKSTYLQLFFWLLEGCSKAVAALLSPADKEVQSAR